MTLENYIALQIGVLDSYDSEVNKLYEALESLSTDKLNFHRNIILHLFHNNEGLVEIVGDNAYFRGSKILYDKDVNKTHFQELCEAISSCEDEYDLTKDEDLEEIKNWVGCVYKEFLLGYFIVAFTMYSKQSRLFEPCFL